MKRRAMFCSLLALFIGTLLCGILAANAAGTADVKPYIDTLEKSEKGMTLWQLIVAGGATMIFIGLLSIAGLACIIYNFRTLSVQKLIPPDFADNTIDKLEKRRFQIVEELCRANDNLLSNFILAGLKKSDKGTLAVKEAMERRAQQDMAGIWRILGYLSDIAVIAPLLGLLGTVLGMIQAFNVIAFETAVVKPILLAAGVAKATVTTAFGLIVAIPAVGFHAYFRNKAQVINDVLEGYLTDVTKLMLESSSPRSSK